MEGACWKCGSVLHHNRDCQEANTDVRVRNEIQRFRNVVTHPEQHASKNAIRLEKWANKICIRDSVPPFVVVKHEVSRLSDVFQEIDREMDAIPELSNTDVGVMTRTLDGASNLLESFSKENAAVRDIRVTSKIARRQWVLDDEVELLLSRMDELSDVQIKLNVGLYKKKSQFKTTLCFLKDWNESKETLERFIAEGIETYNGRPLRIAQCKREWPEKKSMLRKMKDQLEKFNYLFLADSQRELNSQLEVIYGNWKLLKSCKTNYEMDVPRDVCKVCYDTVVTVALACGHLYCSSCIQGINECGFCRQSASVIIPLRFD